MVPRQGAQGGHAMNDAQMEIGGWLLALGLCVFIFGAVMLGIW